MKRLKEMILSLLFPRRAVCIGCGTMIGCDRNDLCEDCRALLAAEKIGPRPVPKGSAINGMAFAYPYRGTGGALVRALKYNSVRVIADEMSLAIADAVEQLRIKQIDIVTFVPMHPNRERVRGFNHAELLARGVAKRIGVPCEALLVRTRNAKQQARLDKKLRDKNLKEGFAATLDLEGKSILLIDDVMTTGATAKYCAKALQKAGARQIWFAAFCMGVNMQ